MIRCKNKERLLLKNHVVRFEIENLSISKKRRNQKLYLRLSQMYVQVLNSK